uniref:Uncharacterized protein n=1 Tax=Arundo donax TaxID=35708 RepID=A0A0A9GB32_ARUDO
MMSCVAMEPADADAVAADIICSLRGADLAGWTPPWWCKTEAAAPAREGELIWPAVARGKRSRRRSPSAVSGKGRWGRASPASPLDYSGGSGSGASTSGGEDGGFCSPGHRRVAARLQRRLRLRLRCLHQRRRGRRLLLARPPPRAGDQDELHRTAAVDLPNARSTAPRPATTEENEATGGPATGAVSRRGE